MPKQQLCWYPELVVVDGPWLLWPLGWRLYELWLYGAVSVAGIATACAVAVLAAGLVLLASVGIETHWVHSPGGGVLLYNRNSSLSQHLASCKHALCASLACCRSACLPTWDQEHSADAFLSCVKQQPLSSQVVTRMRQDQAVRPQAGVCLLPLFQLAVCCVLAHQSAGVYTVYYCVGCEVPLSLLGALCHVNDELVNTHKQVQYDHPGSIHYYTLVLVLASPGLGYTMLTVIARHGC